MDNSSRSSFEELASSNKIAKNVDGETMKSADVEVDNICDDCSKVPWESFGTSEDPASYTSREPFVSWKYIVPRGRLWPGHSTCRICSFIRELLAEYGFDDMTCVRKLRGGWDGERPFKMTFLELDDENDDSSADSARTEDGCNTRDLRSESEFHANVSETTDEEEDIEDDTYTIWDDDDDAYHTFTIPSFFATSLKARAFQSAMQLYKPTNANLSIVKSWLDECNSVHNERCNIQCRQNLRNLKVIDCVKRAIVAAPPHCPFVALSYVWGPPSAQPNLATSDISMALPQTIEDSMVMARELGFTYLWVDRYCINQDDKQEKQEQIAQMADIYASAAVTIIAAAGEDPGHGLPGIRRLSRGLCRYEKVRSIRLFANPSIAPRDRYSPYYVHESKWASRAWTFQECFNSPRRLFFTTEQITLICNSTAYQETAGITSLPNSNPIYTNLRGWLNTGDETPVSAAVLNAIPHPLAKIMDTLMVYSQRRMSYDSDALNAIVGTLNAFARHAIQHLWGVPLWSPNCEVDTSSTAFQPSTEGSGIHQKDKMSDNIANTNPRFRDNIKSRIESSMALLWHNHSPCYRRAGFPSWSPLGWKEGDDWPTKQGIGWSFRQTPLSSGGDFLTLLASCHGLKTSLGSETLASHEYASADYNTSDAVPQKIIVEARTVQLRLALSPDGVTSDCYRDCVAVQLNHDLDVLMAAKWDEAPWEMDANTSLKGLVIPIANSGACCSDSPHYAFIIVRHHDDHWERVAIALVTNNYIRPLSEERGPICEFPHGYRPLFRQISTGFLYTWDQRRFNERGTEVLDLSHVELEHSELWWRRCSQLESIILM